MSYQYLHDNRYEVDHRSDNQAEQVASRAAVTDKKFSGLGIASFVISIVATVLLFLLFIIAGIIEVSTPGGVDESSATAVIIGFFLITFMFVLIAALGLGIGGIFQKGRKKIFAILGVIFSALTFIGITVLMLT